MTTCSLCRISSWHPEARTCTVAGCELRSALIYDVRPAPASAFGLAAGVLSLAPGVTSPGGFALPPAAPAGGLYPLPLHKGAQQLAGDGEAQSARCGAEAGAIHDQRCAA